MSIPLIRHGKHSNPGGKHDESVPPWLNRHRHTLVYDPMPLFRLSEAVNHFCTHGLLHGEHVIQINLLRTGHPIILRCISWVWVYYGK